MYATNRYPELFAVPRVVGEGLEGWIAELGDGMFGWVVRMGLGGSRESEEVVARRRWRGWVYDVNRDDGDEGGGL